MRETGSCLTIHMFCILQRNPDHRAKRNRSSAFRKQQRDNCDFLSFRNFIDRKQGSEYYLTEEAVKIEFVFHVFFRYLGNTSGKEFNPPLPTGVE